NSTTFKVTGPDGAISGTVTYDRSSNTAVFTPIAPLMPQAEYTATASKEIREKSGTALSDSASWKFRTGKDFLARSAEEVIPKTLFGQHIIESQLRPYGQRHLLAHGDCGMHTLPGQILNRKKANCTLKHSIIT